MARKLLIVACGSYTGDLSPLSSSISDAERLATLLGKRNIGNFVVIKVVDPSLVEAQVAIHQILAEASNTDLTVLYLSGHGLKDAYGRFYLALPETALATLPASSLSGRFIREQLADTDSRQVVLILDTCFAGAFSRDMIAKSAPHASGLTEELTSERGHAVIAATSAIQYAFETIEISPTSLFTKTMCDAIESGAADLNADGVISLGELFDYTAEQIREESRAQTPEVSYMGVNSQIRIANAPVAGRHAEIENEISLALSSPHPEMRLAAATVLSMYAKDANKKRSSMARAMLRGLRNDENAAIRRMVGSSLGRIYRLRSTTAEFKASAVSIEGYEWASADGRSLKLAGLQVPRFASFGDDLPVLTTVALRLSESSLEIVATDRYRLDWRRLQVLACGAAPFFVLISANDFSVLSTLPEEAEVRIVVRDRDVCFSVGMSVLHVRRELRYDFPKTDSIFHVSGATCSVKRIALIEGIESLICDGRMRLDDPILISSTALPRPLLHICAAGKAKLRGRALQISIYVKGSVADTALRLDYHRLLEALDSFEQDTIFLHIPHSSGPVLILDSEKDASHRHAIMPIESAEG